MANGLTNKTVALPDGERKEGGTAVPQGFLSPSERSPPPYLPRARGR
jgi:hypothetical protein